MFRSSVITHLEICQRVIILLCEFSGVLSKEWTSERVMDGENDDEENGEVCMK